MTAVVLGGRCLSGCLGVAVALSLVASGCLRFTLTGHEVDFRGTVVDFGTGEPVSGIAVVVHAGGRLVYDGATDSGGHINFKYDVKCCHRSRLPLPGEEHRDRLSVTFLIDAGDYGTVEVPVVFEHDMQHMSLGDIRVIHEERP